MIAATLADRLGPPQCPDRRLADHGDPHPIGLSTWTLSEVARILVELPELDVFGQDRPPQPPDLGFHIQYIGRLSDDLILHRYAAADVSVIHYL